MRSMLGVRQPIIPRLLKLMFHVPMSSPQITRMFGFPSFACAGPAGSARAAHATSDARTRRARGDRDRDEAFMDVSSRPHGESGTPRAPCELAYARVP